MGKGEKDSPSTLAFSHKQFEDLKRLLQSCLRVLALGAIQRISEEDLQKNTWLLNTAGYSQVEIATILQSSQPTISRILSGKPVKLKPEEKEK
jgi:hypothetical protein